MKKNYIPILLLTVTCFLKSNFTKAQVNVQDSLALVELYNSTNGPNWTRNDNWLTTKSVSNWYGIRLFNNRVTTINLSNNNLTGNISKSVGNLTNLSYLILSNNQLSGKIPSTLGKLQGLYTLALNHNKITAISPELGNAKRIRTLTLESNKITGNIPADLGKLKDLRELDLDSNELSGAIPEELGNIPKLSFLNLSHNQLTGKIPLSLGNFDGTVSIDLSFNKLSDSIPSTFSKIENLRTLDLSHNSLTGNIPAAFSNFKNLRTLQINNNKLTGKLPSFLNNLNALTTLILYSNRYTFDGLGTLVQHNFNVFEYAPQKNIAIIKNKNSLFVSAGGKLTNNTYKWYRNGQLNATITGDSTFQPATSGDYNVEVTNSIATELTLYSDTVTYNTTKSFIASQSDNLIGNKPPAISVYPNPARTNTTLSFCAIEKYTITITDVSGKLLQTKTGTAIKGKNDIQLDVSKYPQGMYLIIIVNDKNQKQTLQLNKE